MSNAYIVTISVMCVTLIILLFGNLMSINMYGLKHGKSVIASERNNLRFIVFLCHEHMLCCLNTGVHKFSSGMSADERQVMTYKNL